MYRKTAYASADCIALLMTSSCANRDKQYVANATPTPHPNIYQQGSDVRYMQYSLIDLGFFFNF